MNPLIRTGHYIDGQWTGAGPTYPVFNPANGALIAEVQRAGAEETQWAIDAAHRALPAWRTLTAKQRSQRLKRWSELMLSHQQDLARLLSQEQGKPLAEALGEVVYAASFLEWFGEEAKRAYGDVIPSHKADARIIVVKEAIGVVAAITPWNFPPGHGHAQGRPGAGGRLHNDSQTVGRNATVGLGFGGAGRAGGDSRRCAEHRFW